ncbi:MAG: hypothetical protein M1834_003820 [Cirrosporium novae-zelandiae]|nr:MAG: hypothetical protein M1834_003820 [Cirrosporium novae-zelandiae]
MGISITTVIRFYYPLALILLFWLYVILDSRRKPRRKIPISVNYHFTRRCNYECGFCFHTASDSYHEPLNRAYQGLSRLALAGLRKLNFAGGEPFLYPKYLGQLAKYCKEELSLESVSIVTNGSKVTETWMQEYGKYIDIMAISVDSFNEATNVRIGRGKGDHLPSVVKCAKLCHRYGIKFKLNTVVNKYNFQEDMNEGIREIAPFRWKCFQVLVVPGENENSDRLRNAQDFVISDQQYQVFCDKHSHNKCFVHEPNGVMRSSYLILDEHMRFLNRPTQGAGKPTASILDVGVDKALEEVIWDEEGFKQRGGIYDWSRDKGLGVAYRKEVGKKEKVENEDGGAGCKTSKNMEW